MIGLWDTFYKQVDYPMAYGPADTYRVAADFLSDVEYVEDWGCGKGYFKTVSKVPVIGVDGSGQPDIKVDLTNYRSAAPGILLRHVLDHNWDWDIILNNALESFTKKLVVILYLKPYSSTIPVDIVDLGDGPIPCLRLNERDLEQELGNFDKLTIGEETVYLIRKTG